MRVTHGISFRFRRPRRRAKSFRGNVSAPAAWAPHRLHRPARWRSGSVARTGCCRRGRSQLAMGRYSQQWEPTSPGQCRACPTNGRRHACCRDKAVRRCHSWQWSAPKRWSSVNVIALRAARSLIRSDLSAGFGAIIHCKDWWSDDVKNHKSLNIVFVKRNYAKSKKKIFWLSTTQLPLIIWINSAKYPHG